MATNRNARRKQGAKINYDELASSTQFSSVIKIFLIILCIFILFYILTSLAVDMNSKKTYVEEKATAVIQYEEILAGNTFLKPEGEYYVLFYDSKASDASIYSTLVSSYRKSNSTVSLYIVNMNNGFNKSYISGTSNVNAQDATSLKINGPTLIHIKSGRNISYKEGKEAIKNILNKNS